MMYRLKLLASMLMILLTTTIIAIALPTNKAPKTRSAEVLIENAQRLQRIVLCRNNVIKSNINVSELGTLWKQIINYTRMGNESLEASLYYNSTGNYTEAMIDAIWAIRYYGKTISFQAHVLGKYNISFNNCTVAALNLTKIHRPSWANETMQKNDTLYNRLSLKISILEQQLNNVSKILSGLNLTADDKAKIDELISQAQKVLDKAKSLLNSSQLTETTVSQINSLLAQVHSIFGKINSYIAKIGIQQAYHRALKQGIKMNITEKEFKQMKHEKAFQLIKKNLKRHGLGKPSWANNHSKSNKGNKNGSSSLPGPIKPPKEKGKTSEHGKRH